MSFTNISLYTHICIYNYMLATQTMSLQTKVIHMLISSEAVCVQVRLWQSHQSDWLLHFIYFLIIILYKLIYRVKIDLMIKHLAIDPTPKMHSVVPTDKFLKCLSILQLNGFHGYEVFLTGWHQRPDYTSFHVQRICIIERHDPSTVYLYPNPRRTVELPLSGLTGEAMRNNIYSAPSKPLSETNIPGAICTPALVLIETDTSAARAG